MDMDGVGTAYNQIEEYVGNDSAAVEFQNENTSDMLSISLDAFSWATNIFDVQ